jgi:hypothetical protein
MTDQPDRQPEDISKLSPPPRRPNWLSLLLCAVIFLSGVVIGVAGYVVYEQTRPWPRPRPSMDERVQRMTDRFSEAMDLTPEQQEQLKPVVRKRLENTAEIYQQIVPKYQQEFRILDQHMKRTLTEGQWPKWNKLRAALYLRWFRQPIPEDFDSPSTRPTSSPATRSAP